MKDKLGLEAVQNMAKALAIVLADFPEQQFIKQAYGELEHYELKQRVDHLIRILAMYLPADFTEAANVLVSLKEEDRAAQLLTGFTAWPLIDYVSVYGLDKPELALNVLKSLTSLFSAEFAVRPFIEQHFELTYPMLLQWTQDSDEHVRRLASEGCRPRLPWAKQLTAIRRDPSNNIILLEHLLDDDSAYVRRSVANNLNDISKDHPERVLAVCEQWLQGASQQRRRLIHHALRSLIKAGKPAVFPILGYSEQPALAIDCFELSRHHVKIGETLNIELRLRSETDSDQALVVDLQLFYKKANGHHSAKVYKWKNIRLKPYEAMSLTKTQAFTKLTTRHYYPGEHYIALLINGKVYQQLSFELMSA